MGFWAEQVVPRLVDRSLGTAEVDRFRAEVAAGLRGEVVEIGFGSGRSLATYPPEVTRVLAVEPSAVARRMAAERITGSAVPVEVVGLDGQSLPLPDASADGALSAFSLCTIPDVDTALAEVRRVLRPGAPLHVLEHGLAPDTRVAAWQHRLDPLQVRLAAGCHLDRPIRHLLERNGFEVEAMRNTWMPGPGILRPWGHLSVGVARRPA